MELRAARAEQLASTTGAARLDLLKAQDELHEEGLANLRRVGELLLLHIIHA